MTAAVSGNLNFDPDQLREKYRQERDKRIRSDGNDQYIEVTGDFSHYVDDPYVEPGFERAPVTTQVEVLIIGGGFGGMLAAARLRDAGINDLMIVEKGGALVVPGTGIATPEPRVILSLSFIFPFLRRLDLFPSSATRTPRRHSSTVNLSRSNTSSMTLRSCKRRFSVPTGRRKRGCGLLAQIEGTA
jgi:hypothetical protein